MLPHNGLSQNTSLSLFVSLTQTHNVRPPALVLITASSSVVLVVRADRSDAVQACCNTCAPWSPVRPTAWDSALPAPCLTHAW